LFHDKRSNRAKNSVDKEEVIAADPSTSSASDSVTSSEEAEEKDGDVYTKRSDVRQFQCAWCPDEIRHAQVWSAPDGWCCANCWQGYFGCAPGNGTGIFSKGKMKYMVPLKVKARLSRKELSDEWRGRKFAVHKFKAPPKRETPDLTRRRLNHNEQSYDIRVVCKPNAVGTVAREEESRNRGWHASPPAHTLLCAKRYEVLEKIAAGNFNVVFKVLDTKINKICCLKIDSTMTFQIAQDLLVIHRRLEFAQRDFLFPRIHNEGFMFAYGGGIVIEDMLSGPNCWKIEEKDDQFFKDVGHLRVLARDVLWALAELDSLGVIHCDVKPDNIVRLDVTDEDRAGNKFSNDSIYCPEYVFDLNVVVCKASGLPPLGDDTESNIYVELAIGGQKFKTVSVPEQFNPVWDESVEFKDLDFEKSTGLTAKIYSGKKDTEEGETGKREYLGQVAIPRGKLIDGTGFDLFGDGNMFTEELDISVPGKYEEIAYNPKLCLQYDGHKRDTSYDKLLGREDSANTESPYPNKAKVHADEAESTEDKQNKNLEAAPPTMNLTIEIVRAERLPLSPNS
jgi:hypothetical protein